MSKGVKEAPVGNIENEKRKYLSLWARQKVELLLKFDRGVPERRLTEEYVHRVR
jgi:hypothetical protein